MKLRLDFKQHSYSDSKKRGSTEANFENLVIPGLCSFALLLCHKVSTQFLMEVMFSDFKLLNACLGD
ncbi:hypothetical protein ACTXT7_010904 [Hymenolepis weldensis]